MVHCNTILNQITAFFPKHNFEYLAKVHHKGKSFGHSTVGVNSLR